jgi:hypothetical protein
MLRIQTARRALRLRQIVALMVGVVGWVVTPIAAPAAEPGSSPSRLLPARALTFYVEYDGLGAHAGAWKATAAYEMLHGTPAGALLADIARQFLTPDPQMRHGTLMTGADYIALGERVVQSGFALACYGEDRETPIVLVLKGLGVKESRDRFERWVRYMLSTTAPAKLPTPIRHRGRDLYQIPNQDNAEGKPRDELLAGVTWWFEGDDLILFPRSDIAGTALSGIGGPKKDIAATDRARVATVLDTIDGKEPNASSHPGYAAAIAEGKDLTGFEPDGMFFAETTNPLGMGVLSSLRDTTESLPGMKKGGGDEFDFLDALDISRARRIVARWGFLGKSLLTDIRFEASAPWSGLVGLLKPTGFRKDSLPPIPRGMGAFAVGSFVRGDLRAANASLDAKVISKYREGFRVLEEAFRNATTQRLREDLFRHLGPSGCIFASPGGANDTVDSAVASVLIGVDDAEAAGKALDALATCINAYFSDIKRGEAKGAGKQAAGGRPAFALEPLPAPDHGYRLTAQAGFISWLTDEVQPTILLGKSFIAVANNPVLARAAIAAESRPAERWVPTGELVKMWNGLPAMVAFLSVGNPRDSFWPETIASLPELVAPYLGKLEAINPAGEPPTPRSLKVPKADALKALLFPSVLAAIVEDRGLRVITLEALPIGCLRTESKREFTVSGQSINVEFQFAPRR